MFFKGLDLVVLPWNKKLEILSTEGKKLDAEIQEIKDNKIYENDIKWRFEFPVVLDDKGNYVGFDVVIGNPPYVPGKDIYDSHKLYLRNNYNLISGKYELYIALLERAL